MKIFMTSAKGGGKTWTVEMMRQVLASNDIMVERSILELYKRQTHDEQNDQMTKHHNARGFNGLDAKFLSSLAQWILRPTERKEGMRLSIKQREVARKKLMKYAGQLVEIANTPSPEE
jgi:hypothetical protein